VGWLCDGEGAIWAMCRKIDMFGGVSYRSKWSTRLLKVQDVCFCIKIKTQRVPFPALLNSSVAYKSQIIAIRYRVGFSLHFPGTVISGPSSWSLEDQAEFHSNVLAHKFLS